MLLKLSQSTLLPQPTSSFLDLLAVCVDSALSCSALALCFSIRLGCSPVNLRPGLRLAEQAQIQKIPVFSCIHFLPQPSLHLAVLLFKNAVSSGLLTSILSNLHLALNQQTISARVLKGFCSISLCFFSSFPGELVGKSRKDHETRNLRPFTKYIPS